MSDVLRPNTDIPPAGLRSSFRYCRRLSARSRSSFRFAFGLLPSSQADAMHALYAYLRQTDDLADGEGDESTKRAALAGWRTRLTNALDGVYSHRVHAALHHTARDFDIPTELLTAPIDGGERDLQGEPFRTFSDLELYCHQVAGVVGLACVRIWGLRAGATWEQAVPLAEAAGLAFQLTNILRDLGEDRERGRVYLPTDEWTKFGCSPGEWDRPVAETRFHDLLRFQVERARGYYLQSAPLAGMLCKPGRAVFTLMAAAYRGLLERVAAAGQALFHQRVRLSRWEKLSLVSRAWVHTWLG